MGIAAMKTQLRKIAQTVVITSGTMQNVHSLNPPEILSEVKEKILEVLRVFRGRVFTVEELQVAIFPRYSIKTIRDAMWELNDEGKAKLWVRLP